MRPLLPLSALALLGACASAGSDAAPREPRLVRLVARDYTFDAPAQVPAGLVRVRLVNQGPAWHEAVVTRLPDSATVASYLAGARAGEPFPAGAVDAGGPGLVSRGDSSEVVLRLAPGRHAVVCWFANHTKLGMIIPLEVTAPDARTASADTYAVATLVRLQDFRFVHEPFRAGTRVLHVRNEGGRPHDMTLYRLNPGQTLREFGAWYRTREGAPPAVPVGGVSTLAAGGGAWVPITFTPGRYFIACGTPEEGGVIHAQMGMIEEFEIQ